MNSFQKTIKYIAGGFAILLAVSIIAIILQVCVGIFGGLAGFSGSKISDSQSFSASEASEIKSLKIDAVGELIIETGDTFTVEAIDVGNGYKCELLSNGELKIDGSGFYLFGFDDAKLIITIPENKTFDKIDIDFGAGSISIDELMTDKIKINLGAGKLNIYNLISADTDLDVGVGKLTVTGTLTGDTVLNNGVGEIYATINGNVEDYRIKLDTGIGDSSLNGDSYSSSYWNNSNGEHTFKADSGIGAVKAYFE